MREDDEAYEGFASGGFTPYPNLYSDRMRVTGVAEWPEEWMRYKLEEYWEFVSREDILEKHRGVANEILNLIGFEIDYRTGFYDD